MAPLMTTSPAGKRVAHGVVASAASAVVTAGKAEAAKTGGSVTVAISGEGRALAEASTQGDAMTERLAKMREALNRIQAMPSGAAQRKDIARARIQQLKDRIEAMRQMMVGLSPAAAKAMAREIRAMAHELKQAAGVLMSGDGDVEADGSAAAATGDAAAAGAGTPAVAAASSAVDAASAVSDATSAADDATSAVAGADLAATGREPQAGAEDTTHIATGHADDDASGLVPTDAKALERAGDVAESEAADAPDAAPSIQAAFRSPAGSGASDADQDLIRKVAAALKSLMAMLKAQMRDAAHDDDIRAAEQSLGTTPGAGPA